MGRIIQPCPDCNGTGKSIEKTAALARADAEFRHRAKHHGSYVRCWSCNGNGIDSVAAFNWGD